MKKSYVKSLVLVGCLIALTCVAMAYSSRGASSSGTVQPIIAPVQAKAGVVTLSGHLVQNKIFSGGDGTVSLSLSMNADHVVDADKGEAGNVDMVIVLDRSGSMEGTKLEYARKAVLNLLSNLSAQDRFGLVTYSDGVQRYSPLVNVTDAERERLTAMIRSIYASGSTNLGGGLQEGINVLLSAQKNGNLGKVILISDGLANRGIVDPSALGSMASIAVEKTFAVSTVGVGNDFNEHLMTTIADRGTGNYYYLENPNAFAEVFQKEFHSSRIASATAVDVRIPLANGISLINAAGYPIEIKDNMAVFHPGDLLSGQTRNLFLTLRVPAQEEKVFEIKGIHMRYLYKGEPYTVALSEPFRIACVKDPKEVVASMDKKEWEKKVLQNDYNQLKEEVAAEIKNGNEKAALDRIQKYSTEQQALNSALNSDEVTNNLNKDVGTLRQKVEETFQGRPPEVEAKQKSAAKSLQFEGYKGKRN